MILLHLFNMTTILRQRITTTVSNIPCRILTTACGYIVNVKIVLECAIKADFRLSSHSTPAAGQRLPCSGLLYKS